MKELEISGFTPIDGEYIATISLKDNPAICERIAVKQNDLLCLKDKYDVLEHLSRKVKEAVICLEARQLISWGWAL